jgi:zinc transporter ZupT
MRMRKRTLFGICVVLGALLLVLLASSDWGLAAVVGMGLGAMIFMFVHAYPNDIAPPSDRRHENTQRRRALQRETLR